MLHSDCGAYGGLVAFDGDAAREARHHEHHLGRARRYVEATLPGVEVSTYFVDFEGVWETEEAIT